MVSLSTALPEKPSNAVVLHDVPWDFYEATLEQIGDQQIRVTYDNGSMEIMSPLPEHERYKKRLARLIETISEEANLPIASLGSTTFRRRDIAKGLEPDECYYLQHEAQVRDKKRLDLRFDPPPDLVVEIDISYRSVDRQAIYASLGVPEVWRFDGQQLQGLRLAPEGHYQAMEQSGVFPFLKLAELQPFLDISQGVDETTTIRTFRTWIRQVLSTH